MRRSANPTDTPPGRLDGLLEDVASKVGQLATLVPVYHRGRSPLRHDHALVLATCVRGVSGRPGTGSPEPSPPSTNSGPQPYKQVSNSTTSHLQHIMAPARNRQVGGSSPPSGSTDIPIDLRFCRLKARRDCVFASWCIRGASISTRCVPAVPVHLSSREGPKATASVISKRLCGGRPITIRPAAPSGRALWVTAREWVEERHDSGHAAGSCLGRIHSRWEHQRPARSPGHLVIEGVFRCR